MNYANSSIEIYPIEQIEINVSIYGSLITGFASQYSQYRGLPSDYERVSDVDMGIVIDENAIEKIKLNGRCLFKKGIYYGPFYERNSNSLGPFVKIFDFIKGLSFAKRNDRKIGLIIVDKNPKIPDL